MSKRTLLAPAKFDGELKLHTADGEEEITIPFEYTHLKIPWMSQKLGKPNGFVQSVTTYYRHKEKGDKPFVPEGTAWIDGKWFKVRRE